LIVSSVTPGIQNSSESVEKYFLKDFLRTKQVFKDHEFFICPDLKREHYDPSDVIRKLGGTVLEKIPSGHYPV